MGIRLQSLPLLTQCLKVIEPPCLTLHALSTQKLEQSISISVELKKKESCLSFTFDYGLLWAGGQDILQQDGGDARQGCNRFTGLSVDQIFRYLNKQGLFGKTSVKNHIIKWKQQLCPHAGNRLHSHNCFGLLLGNGSQADL